MNEIVKCNNIEHMGVFFANYQLRYSVPQTTNGSGETSKNGTVQRYGRGKAFRHSTLL